LDSFALIGYLENESFSAEIEKYLKQARQDRIRIYLHAIHLGEVYYITLREQGQDVADLAFARIIAFPLQYIEIIDEKLLKIAGRLKAIYPISYADSYAAALAINHKAVLFTGSPEFKKIEKEEDVLIHWVG
jgi:predicted nucleic acid-binding protein